MVWRGLGGGITETSPWPLHKKRFPSGRIYSPFSKKSKNCPEWAAKIEKKALIEAQCRWIRALSSILPRLAGKFSQPLAERCGGGPAPGAASPRSGRLKGVMGGVEGFKGEDSELPLIPPHFAAHSGQFLLPFEKGTQPSPWPLHKNCAPPGEFRFPLEKGKRFPSPRG